jgi:predicted nucleotide-binding protein
VAAGSLHKAIEEKTGYSRRHVDRLIESKMSELYVNRHLAMLAIARDARVRNWTRNASDEDLATLGNIARGAAPAARPQPQPAATATASPPKSAPRPRRAPRDPRDADNVFVIHGRDRAITESMYAFLRALDLRPMEWGQLMAATKRATPSIPQTLETALERASAVVVLMTPDDEVRLTPRLHGEDEDDKETQTQLQARPNVYYEAGMAMARHPTKTVFVYIGKVKKFSDISGLHVTTLNDTAPKRLELVSKLGTARGRPIDTHGRDHYLRAGRFIIEEKA